MDQTAIGKRWPRFGRYSVGAAVAVSFFFTSATAQHIPAGRRNTGHKIVQSTQSDIDRERLQLERQKFEFEQTIENHRLELEKTRLEVERRNGLVTAVTAVVPLVVAFLTLFFSIWSFRQQGKRDVELKAAEFAFQGKTPEAVFNRCRALRRIFGKDLPKDFGESFKPEEHGGGKEDSESKKFFLELLLKYPSQRTDVVRYWGQLFGDKWLGEVKPVVNLQNTT